MTISELIEKLKEMPQDYDVVTPDIRAPHFNILTDKIYFSIDNHNKYICFRGVSEEY